MRDLHSVYVDSYRFNRGSLNNEALLSRLKNSGADAAFIVYQHAGNPGRILILQRDRPTATHIMIDSVVLCRELKRESRGRTAGLRSLVIPEDVTSQTRELSILLSEILRVPIVRGTPEVSANNMRHQRVDIHLNDLPDGRTLWTHRNVQDQAEIGPRIRVFAIRVVSQR